MSPGLHRVQKNIHATPFHRFLLLVIVCQREMDVKLVPAFSNVSNAFNMMFS